MMKNKKIGVWCPYSKYVGTVIQLSVLKVWRIKTD
jgi:hypothetical protein